MPLSELTPVDVMILERGLRLEAVRPSTSSNGIRLPGAVALRAGLVVVDVLSWQQVEEAIGHRSYERLVSGLLQA